MFQDDDYLSSIFSQQQEQQTQIKTNRNQSSKLHLNQKSFIQQKNHNQSKQQQNNKEFTKSFLPQQFHKAKRMLNKFVYEYFNELKSQFTRMTTLVKQKENGKLDRYNPSVKIYLNKNNFTQITQNIRKYVGITYKKQQLLKNNFINTLPQSNKKIYNQMRNGSYCYMHEMQKIIALNKKGQITQIKLKYQQKNIKLPQIATPIPFKNTFYLLDASIFDKNKRIFIPDQNCYKISQNGTVTKILSSIQKQQTHIFRIKCAITRDQQYIYLLGGVIGRHKLPTRKCQAYKPSNNNFISLPQMNNHHRSPSGCLLNKKLWVFSSQNIQCLSIQPLIMAGNSKNLKQQQKQMASWINIKVPFSMQIYDFQFNIPVSNTQILIFGGMRSNRAILEVQKYNCELNFSQSYHQILPQPINRIRVWGPVLLDQGFAILSNIQASIQPEVSFRKNTVSTTYITTNGIFLQNISVLK